MCFTAGIPKRCFRHILPFLLSSLPFEVVEKFPERNCAMFEKLFCVQGAHTPTYIWATVAELLVGEVLEKYEMQI